MEVFKIFPKMEGGRNQWFENSMSKQNFSFLRWIINRFSLKLIDQGRGDKRVYNCQTRNISKA